MLWHLEVLIESVLAVLLFIKPDGRRIFRSLICCNLVMEAVMLISERTHNARSLQQVFVVLILFELPLAAMALIESAGRVSSGGSRHLAIFAWWLSASLALAALHGIWSGVNASILIVNIIAFLAWIALLF